MKLSDFTNIFPSIYEAKVPVVLRSAPGIGKSEAINALPTMMSRLYKRKFGLVTVHATALDAPDVLGILMPHTEGTGANKRTVATYSEPHIMRLIRKTKLEHGILFIDEIGQADHLVQKALAPLFAPNERRIGEYWLPDGWFVIGASNRMEDRAGVAKELTHFVNRQCQLEIVAHIEDWISWATEHEVHPMLIAFAKFKPGVVMTNKVPARPGPYCTPRSYTYVNHFMSTMIDKTDNQLPSDPITQQVCSGYIGNAASAELFGFLKVHEFMPRWQDIVDNPKKARTPSQDRLDVAYAISSMITANADENTLTQAMHYVVCMPKEMQVMTIKGMVIKIGPKAFDNAEVKKYIDENPSFLRASLQA